MARPMRFETFEGLRVTIRGQHQRRYFFRARSGNGEVLMQCAKPDGYSSRASARRAAQRFVARIDSGPVEVVDR